MYVSAEAPELATTRAETVQRFGVSYNRYDLDGGVILAIPHDSVEEAPNVALIGDIADVFSGISPLSQETPAEYGYKLYEECNPSFGYRADVYYDATRGEYLKLPIIDKHAGVQFFAMNALDRAVGREESLRFAASSAAIWSKHRRISACFSWEASGVNLGRVLDSVSVWGSQDAHLFRLKRDTKKHIALLAATHVPKSLVALCNDYPGNSPINAQGFQNVFISHPELVEPSLADMVSALDQGMDELTYTLIDQAHPSVRLLTRYAITSRRR